MASSALLFILMAINMSSVVKARSLARIQAIRNLPLPLS